MYCWPLALSLCGIGEPSGLKESGDLCRFDIAYLMLFRLVLAFIPSSGVTLLFSIPPDSWVDLAGAYVTCVAFEA